MYNLVLWTVEEINGAFIETECSHTIIKITSTTREAYVNLFEIFSNMVKYKCFRAWDVDTEGNDWIIFDDVLVIIKQDEQD